MTRASISRALVGVVLVTLAACGSSTNAATTTTRRPATSTTAGPTTTTLVQSEPADGPQVIDDTEVDHTSAESVATVFFDTYYGKFTAGITPAQFAAALAYLTNPTVTAQIAASPPPVVGDVAIGGDTTFSPVGPNAYSLTGTLRSTSSERPVGSVKATLTMMQMPDGTWRVWTFNPGA